MAVEVVSLRVASSVVERQTVTTDHVEIPADTLSAWGTNCQWLIAITRLIQSVSSSRCQLLLDRLWEIAFTFQVTVILAYKVVVVSLATTIDEWPTFLEFFVPVISEKIRKTRSWVPCSGARVWRQNVQVIQLQSYESKVIAQGSWLTQCPMDFGQRISTLAVSYRHVVTYQLIPWLTETLEKAKKQESRPSKCRAF